MVRKRLRKKWHRKWISDVRIEVCQNDQFVQLVAAAHGKKVEINRGNASECVRWDLVDGQIGARNLRYHVWIEPAGIAIIDSEASDGFFYLEFCAVEFPSVKAWAANGLEHFRHVAAKNQKLPH